MSPTRHATSRSSFHAKIQPSARPPQLCSGSRPLDKTARPNRSFILRHATSIQRINEGAVHGMGARGDAHTHESGLRSKLTPPECATTASLVAPEILKKVADVRLINSFIVASTDRPPIYDVVRAVLHSHCIAMSRMNVLTLWLDCATNCASAASDRRDESGVTCGGGLALVAEASTLHHRRVSQKRRASCLSSAILRVHADRTVRGTARARSKLDCLAIFLQWQLPARPAV